MTLSKFLYDRKFFPMTIAEVIQLYAIGAFEKMEFKWLVYIGDSVQYFQKVKTLDIPDKASKTSMPVYVFS